MFVQATEIRLKGGIFTPAYTPRRWKQNNTKLKPFLKFPFSWLFIYLAHWPTHQFLEIWGSESWFRAERRELTDAFVFSDEWRDHAQGEHENSVSSQKWWTPLEWKWAITAAYTAISCFLNEKDNSQKRGSQSIHLIRGKSSRNVQVCTLIKLVWGCKFVLNIIYANFY